MTHHESEIQESVRDDVSVCGAESLITDHTTISGPDILWNRYVILNNKEVIKRLRIKKNSRDSLRKLLKKYPANTIVELHRDKSENVPICLIIETSLTVNPPETFAQVYDISQNIFNELKETCDVIKNNIQNDLGARVSYKWNKESRCLSLHIILPNTHAELKYLITQLRFIRKPTSCSLSTYIGCVSQDSIFEDMPFCIPYSFDSNFKLLNGSEEFILTDVKIVGSIGPASIDTRAPVAWSEIPISIPEEIPTEDVISRNEPEEIIPSDHPQSPTSSVSTQNRQARPLSRTSSVRTRPAEVGLTFMISQSFTPEDATIMKEMVRKPHWLLSKPEKIAFFAALLRRRVGDQYNNLISDVAYTECSSNMELAKRIARSQPSPTMIEKSCRFLKWVVNRECPEDYRIWCLEQSLISAVRFADGNITDDVFHELFVMFNEGKFIAKPAFSKPDATILYFDNTWHVDASCKELHAELQKFHNLMQTEIKDFMVRRGELSKFGLLMTEIIRLTYSVQTRREFIRGITTVLTERTVKFDQDPRLLGCLNVVIELTDTCAKVRPGRPEDLISMNTNRCYREFNDSECEDADEWLRKLFGNTLTRSWIRRVLSSFLYGGNPDRCCFMVIGCKKNGKSKFLDVLHMIFGDYSATFNPKALNDRKDAMSASPELAQLHGKRLAKSSEMDPTMVLECNTLKMFCGGDPVPSRALFEAPQPVIPTFHMVFVSNHKIQFSSPDRATQDRIIFIPCNSIFSGNAPKDIEQQRKENHYLEDVSFKEKLPYIADSLFYLMVKGYAAYKAQGILKFPKEVQKEGKLYWHDQNIQARFIEEHIKFLDKDKVIQMKKLIHKDTGEHKEDSADDKEDGQDEDFCSTPSLTYNDAYNAFIAWASMEKIDIQKFPKFAFKSLMDNEFSCDREHYVIFAAKGWIGPILK